MAKQTDQLELRKAVETLLFITDSPIDLAKLTATVGEKDKERVAEIVAEISKEYEDGGRAMQVLEIAEGFQMATRPAFADFVRTLYKEKMTMRLSTAALETVSIVAYKQPLTRAEIEEIRGVEIIAALETLLEKNLIRVVGRKETVGRPLLYGTTPDFLRQFGLRSIEDLPPLDSFVPQADASLTDGKHGPFEARMREEGEAAPQGSVMTEAGEVSTEGESSAEAATAYEAESPASENEAGVAEVLVDEPAADSERAVEPSADASAEASSETGTVESSIEESAVEETASPEPEATASSIAETLEASGRAEVVADAPQSEPAAETSETEPSVDARGVAEDALEAEPKPKKEKKPRRKKGGEPVHHAGPTIADFQPEGVKPPEPETPSEEGFSTDEVLDESKSLWPKEGTDESAE